VVGAGADEDPADDPPRPQADHDELAPPVVGHVRDITTDGDDVRVREAAKDLQGAKARLSEVIERAQGGPQTITRNGKPSVVVVSTDEWTRKTARKGTLAEFLLASPLRGSDLAVERERDEPRDIDL